MGRVIYLHCDREGCYSRQRKDNAVHGGFYSLKQGGESVAHFCCLDCAMHWCGAHSVPTEVAQP